MSPRLDRGNRARHAGARRLALLSNGAMESKHDADGRLTELEIKAAFTEDLLDQLNMTIYRQQRQIDRLQQQFAQLQLQLPEAGGGTDRMREELPPHY